MIHRQFPIFLFALLLAGRAVPAADLSSRIPLEHFTRLPFLQSVTLSPDGSTVAWLQNQQGTSYLVALPLPAGERRVLTKNDTGNMEFNWVRWGSNDFILASLRFAALRYGVPTMETRLLVIDAVSGEMHPIIDPRRVRWIPQFSDQIIGRVPDDPDHVLFAADLDEPLRVAVYRVNLGNQSRKRIHPPHRDIFSWLVDQQGNVRIGKGLRRTSRVIVGRSAAERKLRTLWEYEILGHPGPEPLGFGSEPDILYVRAPHEGRYAIFSMDLRDSGLPLSLVISDPVYDIAGELIHSPRRRDVVGVYYEGSSGRYLIWDEELLTLQRGIDAVLPDAVNRIVALSDDEERYIVLSMTGNRPAFYYYGDRRSGELMPLASMYPELADIELSDRSQVTITARDGLNLEAIVSLPPAYDGSLLPSVILPHGGPIARDTAGFDYWVEFLVSRGYAVLQVNFRGSAGYGIDFERAAIRNWGLAMQDDVTDATHWLIEQRIADPERICLVGGSYGGYAALMGVIRNPGLYRCAVSFAGVTDLQALMREGRAYLSGDLLREMLGDGLSDQERLRGTSPVHNADKLNVPLLIMHGSDDRAVPIEHSERLIAQLKKAGKEYRYIAFDDGDHYLSRQEHRTAAFREMGKFLDRWLGESAQ